MKYLVAGLLAAAALALTLSSNYADEKDKKDKKEPKYTVKEVMKVAHKEGLYKMVAEGEATQKEKDQLVALYTALAQNKSPGEGDEKDWKERTTKMLAVAKAAAKGDKKAAKSLLDVVQCGACHELHKP
jgi:hypothetical protein